MRLKNRKKLELSLNVSSLSRAHNYFKNNTTGFVTAFKNEEILGLNSSDALVENTERNRALLMNIKSFGYNSYKVDGIYNSITGRIDKKEAFSVQCPSCINEKRFVEDMVILGKRYDQESILIAHPDGTAYLVYCETGNEVKIFVNVHCISCPDLSEDDLLANGNPVLFTFEEDEQHYKERLKKFKEEHPDSVELNPEISNEEIHVIGGDYSWHEKTAGEQFINRNAGKGKYWN